MHAQRRSDSLSVLLPLCRPTNNVKALRMIVFLTGQWTEGYRSLVRRVTGPTFTSSVTIKWTLSHDGCKRWFSRAISACANCDDPVFSWIVTRDWARRLERQRSCWRTFERWLFSCSDVAYMFCFVNKIIYFVILCYRRPGRDTNPNLNPIPNPNPKP